MIIGIDDVSRSPALGSMFIGAVLAEEEDLNEADINDSKRLAESTIRSVKKKYELKVHWVVLEVTPSEIDSCDTINELEAHKMMCAKDKVLERAGVSEEDVDKIYIDNADPNEQVFRNRFDRKLDKDRYVIEHGADGNYPVAGLASIFAKERDLRQRDEMKEDIGIKHPEPMNPKVSEFICDCPGSDWIRRSWKTYKRCEERNFDKSRVLDELSFDDRAIS